MVRRSDYEKKNHLNDHFSLKWSVGKGRGSKAKTVVGTWGKLCGLLSKPWVSTETRAEFDQMSREDQERSKAEPGWWSGAPYRDGRRSSENTLPRDLITLDIDSPDPNFVGLVEAGFPPGLHSYEFVVHSTRKSTAEKRRLRVVIPSTRPITGVEYPAIVRILSSAIEEGAKEITSVDKASARFSQMMFWPSTCRGSEWIFIRFTGAIFDPDELLRSYSDKFGDWTNPENLPLFKGEDSIRESAKKAGDPRKKPGLIGAFNRAHSIHDAIAQFDLPYVLAEEGSGNRYLFTDGSGIAGAVVYGDGCFMFSFHGTDPAGGHLQNAFDLVRRHRFAEADSGLDEKTPMEKRPSFRLMMELASTDDATLKEFAEEQAEAHKRHFDDVDPDNDDSTEESPKKNGSIFTQQLNQKHSVVVIGGRTLIATQKSDGTIDFGKVADLDVLYANHPVPKRGSSKLELISRHWLTDPGRRTYTNGVAMAPGGAPPDTLNLFVGWNVKPDPGGSCELFKRHVIEVMCRGDEDLVAYTFGWLAQMVQYPEDKPGVTMVAQGQKGSGKDTLAEYLMRMIGQRYCPVIGHSRHLTGNFNSHLAQAIFVNLQEAMWAGNRTDEQTLKYLITSPTVAIEPKGLPIHHVTSCTRFFVSSNSNWVIPASFDERRFFFLRVLDSRIGDREYFDALRAEMNGSGPGALLYFLLNYDISNFDIRKVPQTEGLMQQKIASLRDVAAWLLEVLATGKLCGGAWNDSVVIPCDALRDEYAEYARANHYRAEPVDPARFGMEMREWMPGLKPQRPRINGERVYCYRLPCLLDSRQYFETKLGGPVQWNY